jgi:circadian clock protein KaiC
MSNIHKLSTGISGLDQITLGGLIPNRAYLLQGGPGSGKSILSYHFLNQGNRADESTLLISFGEAEDQIRTNAQQLGLDLDDTHILDLTPEGSSFGEDSMHNVFEPGETEREEFTSQIISAFNEIQPQRVVLDSITVFSMMEKQQYQFRKVALSMIKFMCSNGATLLITSERANLDNDEELTFWADGIIALQHNDTWRTLQVTKYRGSAYTGGKHTYRIKEDGIHLFPQMHPRDYSRIFKKDQLQSGVSELDALLHGGLERGTTTIITGPTGVGKTNLGIQFFQAAASRGQRSVIYTFEEATELIVQRSESLNVPITDMLDAGTLKIVPIEPLSYSPDEFAAMVKEEVETHNTKMVMIDTISSYRLAVREGKALERLHALTVYLQNSGVTTLLMNESTQVAGLSRTTEMNASYLADNIIFLQYIEINSELKKAIGVLKKRLSDFEKYIREFKITSNGISVLEPLTNYQGILSGNPTSYSNAGPENV